MRKALLIFRKDVFRLRLELAAWALLMGIYSWMEAVLPARPGWLAAVGIWELILAPAACYLALATIHEDLLPGDRQDWLTKPIPRSSLLLAKLMFVVVFLNLPLALSQVLGLVANGLSLPDFNVLVGIDQHSPRSFLDRVVLGPFCQHRVPGVDQLDLDSLVRWKLESDQVIAEIAYVYLDFQLPDFGQPDRLRRNLQIQNQTV